VFVARAQDAGQALPIVTQGSVPLPGASIAISAPPPIYTLLWRTSLGSAGPQSLALEGEVIVASSDTDVSAFAVADGHALWTSALAPAAPVTTGDGAAYVHTASALVALDLTTGAERWRAAVGPPSTAPIWRSGWVLAASGTVLHALRAKDGTSVWDVTLASAPSGPFAIDGDRVFASIGTDRTHSLVAIDLPSHKTLWTASLDTRPVKMLAANGRLYFGGDDGVYAYAQDDGQRLWTIRQKPGVSIGLAADERAVYVALRNQTVYAFDKASGNQRWKGQLPARPRASVIAGAAQVLVPLDNGDMASWPARDGKPRTMLKFLLAPDAPPDAPPKLEDAVVSADGQRVFVITSAVGVRTLTVASRVLPTAKTGGLTRAGRF
jgi:outer membrane protein assembly factor BamB